MTIGTVAAVFLAGLAILMVGLPIAVVMVLIGTLGGLFALGPAFIDSIGAVVWSTQNANLMTCVPLFILMGEFLLRTGIADGMYQSMAVLLRGVPGGLLHTNIACSALFAATTGSSVACAATMANVALPELDQGGYDRRQALGSLAAGGTLGILIPPSIALLIYGGLTTYSISKLFVGGVVPGILLTSCFMLFIFLRNLGSKSIRTGSFSDATWGERFRALWGLFPPVTIFVVIMGSMY